MNPGPQTTIPAALEEGQPPAGWALAPGSLDRCLDNLNEWIMEDKARASGFWEVFQNSRRVAGFEKAKQAWLSTARNFLRKSMSKKLASPDDSSPQTIAELFFWKLRANASKALVEFAPLVHRAAQQGDVEFFGRMAAEVRRARRNKPLDSLEGNILIHWMSCCLWLASDNAASTYLQQVTKKTVEENSYARARQRLEKRGLVGYSIAHSKPLIVGCTKQATFIFRKGWTNLVPTSSR